MKILVIENEYDSIKNSFEFASAALFKGKLQITNEKKSQSVPLSDIDKYDAIFVDISLATKSQKDGFGIIKDILSKDDTLANRIVILTGNNKIEERIREHNLESFKIKVLYKPISYKDVGEAIRECITGTICQ